LLQRAQARLGTLVLIRVQPVPGEAPGFAPRAHAAMTAAFATLAQIERVMSAHRPDSDLARLAAAPPGTTVVLDAHTMAVLRLARYWSQASLGAFDPVRAAQRLHARQCRPAFDGLPFDPLARLHDLHEYTPTTVYVRRPLWLDLGGIAKGYAVDQAVAVLRHHGLGSALVNAGGDLRAFGPHRWPLALRQPLAPTRSTRAQPRQRPRQVQDAAIASSTAGPANAEHVPSGRRHRASTTPSRAALACTVQAPDCVTADALTKLGFGMAPDAPRLMRLLHRHGARMWVQAQAPQGVLR